MISSLSCISIRADLSVCVKLSVLGICTSTLCLISDLIRSMTDSSLEFLLGFGIQLLFLTNLGISMNSFMSDSYVDRSSLVSFFEWKYSLILSRRANWSRSSSSSRTFILRGFGQKFRRQIYKSNNCLFLNPVCIYYVWCTVFRGLLERLTTTLDFLFSIFCFRFPS
jgi:hypothetical protein